MNECRNTKHKKGMTLLEILLVLALLGTVITLVAKNLAPQFTKGKADAVKIKIQNLQQDLDRFYFDCGRYPTTAQGLESLSQAPSVPPECKNYSPNGYISAKNTKSALKDEWGNALSYKCDDGINYEISSVGPDGKPGTDDDISSNEAE